MRLLLRTGVKSLAAAAVVAVAWAQPTPSARPIKRVLAIHGGPETFPGNSNFDALVSKVLFAHPTIEVDYQAEFLENEEFGPAADTALRESIRLKFRDRPLDAVVANTAVALQFALGHRDELFPGLPIVFLAATPPAPVLRREITGVTGVVRDQSQRETIDLALKLHPGTTRVHVIAYAPAAGGYQQRVMTTLADASKRVTLTYANEPTLSEAVAAIRQLPTDSLVFYARYTAGTEGRLLLSDEALPRIAAASPVPTYSGVETHLGMGVVGGMMRNERHAATRVGEIILRVLEGANPDDIPIEAAHMSPMFDWRQIQRFGIDRESLPPGAEIRFREPTVWELYQTYIIGTIVIVTAQLLLISGLMTQRARLRRADATIRARESALRTSYERIKQLAGRLINAQEAARASIARDLHDDVCQRLAHVTLGVTSLKHASGDIQDAPTQLLLDELDRDAHNTFDGIRRLSHDLHPATLRLLGLVPALRAHCNEVAARNGVAVQFSAGDSMGDVNPDVAVCLFRIAQESLRNGIEHGSAEHLTVTLQRDADWLELSVTDDGRGFNVSETWRQDGGLGLVTMEERVNLVGGNLSVASEIGRGTTVRARVPVDPPSAR